jgi:hypothetical protein
MADTLIPIWIIGGPFIGFLILSFAFKGPSSMSGGRGSRSTADSGLFSIKPRK